MLNIIKTYNGTVPGNSHFEIGELISFPSPPLNKRVLLDFVYVSVIPIVPPVVNLHYLKDIPTNSSGNSIVFNGICFLSSRVDIINDSPFKSVSSLDYFSNFNVNSQHVNRLSQYLIELNTRHENIGLMFDISDNTEDFLFIFRLHAFNAITVTQGYRVIFHVGYDLI